MNRRQSLIVAVLVLVIGMVLILFVVSVDTVRQSNSETETSEDGRQADLPEAQELAAFGLETNTANSLIDLDLVLNGGPGKDGIPAIDEPKFISVDEAGDTIDDDSLGMLLMNKGEVKYYPYNILVWHEIVNDTIGEVPVVVTFCPLCGSAIAYEREILDQPVSFGVSGLLYESNLLMYDRETETLWSQIEGRAVVGDYAGTELDLFPVQLLDFATIKQLHPDSKVLSTDTGYSRDYDLYPYGDYEENDDEFLFPVSYKGEQLPAKDIVYAVNVGDVPVAFRLDLLKQQGEAILELENGEELVANYSREDETITVKNSDQEELPGYFTMWFFFANHNLPEGVNPNAKGEVWGI